MKPELLTNPRSTPLALIYLGGAQDLIGDLSRQASELGVQLNPRTIIEVRDTLQAASLGRLRLRKDIKIIKTLLPDLMFELRLDLFDVEFVPIKARLFVTEEPPNKVNLISWFLKPADESASDARVRQNQAAAAALRKWKGCD